MSSHKPGPCGPDTNLPVIKTIVIISFVGDAVFFEIEIEVFGIAKVTFQNCSRSLQIAQSDRSHISTPL